MPGRVMYLGEACARGIPRKILFYSREEPNFRKISKASAFFIENNSLIINLLVDIRRLESLWKASVFFNSHEK